jgi:hypothetical protein
MKTITPKNIYAKFKTTKLILFNLNIIILQLNITLVV